MENYTSEDWDRAEEETHIEINGKAIDPLTLQVVDYSSASPHTLVVFLSSFILVHVLQECGVEVTQETLLTVLRSHLQRFPREEMTTYLDLLQAPRIRSLRASMKKGVWDFLWGRKPIVFPPAKWGWTSVDTINHCGNLIVISGKCYRCGVTAVAAVAAHDTVKEEKSEEGREK